MLSTTALREGARARGYPVSLKQFNDYRYWKLIPEPDPETGRWPVEVIDRLNRIRALGDDVRSLPRRVLVLKAEPGFHRIPVEKVREAMLVVIPSIEAPAAKMRRFDLACRTVPGSGTRPKRVPSPPYKEWHALVQDAEDDLFANRLTAHYHFAMSITEYARHTEHDISDIPFEERIIPLTVRDLAIQREERVKSERRITSISDLY